MNRKSHTTVRTLMMLLIVSVGVAAADDFEIMWYTIGDAAGVSTGGEYTLSGTIGEPEAGTMSDWYGTFILSGGFEPGIVPGDCDGDADADLDEFAQMEACLLGPGGELGLGCDCFDFDADADVDLRDFAIFEVLFTKVAGS